MTPRNGREAAVAAVRRLNDGGAYSNIVVNSLLTSCDLPPRERALATAIIYGTVEHRLTIDYLLSRCASRPQTRWHPVVTAIAQTAVCQLLYMDRIPASAAVNEAVSMTRRFGQPSAAGFVNGVLRGVLRRQEELLSALDTETAEGLAIKESCPAEWIRFWEKAYGKAAAYALVQSLNGAPPAYVRVNTALTTTDALTEKLALQGISAKKCADLENCLQLLGVSERNPLEKTEENCYYYQDKASQLCCAALEAAPGMRVADVCAAPGGKSLTLSQYLRGEGEILAGDCYAAKCEELRRRAQLFGAKTVRVEQRDASTPCPPERAGRFDRVLCDVPCSGLGVIRRKPEIRYKSPEQFADLPALQYRILEESSKMTAKGGYLQYSTCTLNPAENEQVVERFLREHPAFVPRTLPLSACFAAAGSPPSWRLTLFPHLHGSDGFFIAGFVRQG